jgi:hypothetical protein
MAFTLLKQSHRLKAQVIGRIGRIERQGIQSRQQLLQTITRRLSTIQAEHSLGLAVEKLQATTEVADQNPLFNRSESRRRITQQLPVDAQASWHQKSHTRGGDSPCKPFKAG